MTSAPVDPAPIAAEPTAIQPTPAPMAPLVEVARAIQPAAVTEEEIAALLETALFARHEPVVSKSDPLLPAEETPVSASPRRRELPRRSEAA